MVWCQWHFHLGQLLDETRGWRGPLDAGAGAGALMEERGCDLAPNCFPEIQPGRPAAGSRWPLQKWVCNS